MNPAEVYDKTDKTFREKDDTELKVILCEMPPRELVACPNLRIRKTREQQIEELESSAKNSEKPASFVRI